MATISVANRRCDFPQSYPLTPLQEGMLFHSLRAPEAGFEVQQLIADLNESLDVPAFHRAWQRATARHDVLRTAFRYDGVVVPMQSVLPAVELPWVEQDWQDLSDGDRAEGFAAFLQADRARGFNVGNAPLQRLTLLRWTGESFRLVWTFHHAILDGRSMVIVLRDVFALYDRLRRGDRSDLPAALPFRAHVERWRDPKLHGHAKLFWSDRLAGITAPTPLVVESRQTPSPRPLRGEAKASLSASSTERLRSFCESHDLTMNTVLQGAWALLWHRYSGEDTVVFGAARACRHSSVEGAVGMVGLLINTVPIVSRLEPGADLASWLAELRRQWTGLREFENTPLTLVQSWSSVPATKPLFETIVVFERYQLNELLRSGAGDWAGRHFELQEQPGNPLTLAAYDGRELGLKILYDRSRFDDATLNRMLGHLQVLLGGMVAHPSSPLCELPLISPEEARRLARRRGTNRTVFRPALCLHELFELQVERSPDAIAVVCGDESVSYQELNRRANGVAAELQRNEAAPGTLVAICTECSIASLAGILGILKAGGAYVPIDPRSPPERWMTLLDDCQARLVLTQRELVSSLPPSDQRKVLCLEDLTGPAGDDREVTRYSGATRSGPRPKPADAAYVIYTSGSTGKPKGVVATHHNVVRLLQATQHWFQFGRQDVWTLFHSLAFDFSVWEMWGALLHGGRLVLVPYSISRSPEAFRELLARERVTVLNQTPSAFRQLIRADELMESAPELSLRWIILGGEALELSSLKPWFDRHGDQTPQVVNMYGITETTVHVTYRPIRRSDLANGSVIGVPIPDLEIHILDEQRRPVPLLVPGEIYVGGAGVTRGYLERPELTADRFIPNPFGEVPHARLYRTGDQARFLADGDIEYLGRVDEQIKIRGFRIEPGEVQAALTQHPLIREAAVVRQIDQCGEQRLVAYLVVRGALNRAELRRFLQERLPEYMLPSAVVVLDRLPLTRNGKIDHRALPAPERQSRDEGKAFVPPSTALERSIAKIWGELLGADQVGLDDNFFEMGGHSLLLVRLHYRLQAALERDVPITRLFQYPTIRALTQHLNDPTPASPQRTNDRLARMRRLQGIA